jgi:hypothetical protein
MSNINTKHDWVQTWANYYHHMLRNKTAEEAKSILTQEREAHTTHILRSREHLAGIDLFFEQSPIADPNPPGKREEDQGPLSPDTVADEPGISTDRGDTHELSDKEL